MCSKAISRTSGNVNKLSMSSTPKSPECVVPSAFDSNCRQQSVKVGTLNLVSTMIGGGALSLPYAISRSGVILGFIFLTVSAIASIFSFDILTAALRRSGALNYQQLGWNTFGKHVSLITAFLIWLLTYLTSIGYCIIIGDLIKPIVCYAGNISESTCSSEWIRQLVIAAAILCVSPFCYMRQITALTWASVMSVIGFVALAIIITVMTAQTFGQLHNIYYVDESGFSIQYQISNEIKLFPTSFKDVMYVFPVFGIAFMCHFNICQVHSELIRPTRKRMRYVFVWCVASCYILYLFIGFFGYFNAFEYTCGDVLLNYDQNSLIISIARLCIGFVTLFSFPHLILPARSNLHYLLNMICSFQSMNLQENTNTNFISFPNAIDDETIFLLNSTSKDNSVQQKIHYDTFEPEPNTDFVFDRKKTVYNLMSNFMTRSYSNLDSPLIDIYDALDVINDPSDIKRTSNEDFTKRFCDFESVTAFKPSKVWLIGETTIMIFLSLIVAFSTSSVMVLWTLVGSTVTFIIAFTLPGLFYVKIRKHKGYTMRNIFASILATLSCVAIILCTWQAIVHLVDSACPFTPPILNDI